MARPFRSLTCIVAMVQCSLHWGCQREPARVEKAAATTPAPSATPTPSATPAPSATSSPATSERTPVARAFAAREGRAAVIDRGQKSEFAKGCLIHKACPALPRPTPCSSSGSAPIDVARLADLPLEREGELVIVRGPLAIGPQTRTLKGCGSTSPENKRTCCNRGGGSAILGEGNVVVVLAGLNCSGDDSRSCCNAPAFGQHVTVLGTLRRFPRQDYGDWFLQDARLCAE